MFTVSYRVHLLFLGYGIFVEVAPTSPTRNFFRHLI